MNNTVEKWFFWIAEGKVATVCRKGGQMYKLSMANFLGIPHAKIIKIGWFLTELFEK